MPPLFALTACSQTEKTWPHGLACGASVPTVSLTTCCAPASGANAQPSRGMSAPRSIATALRGIMTCSIVELDPTPTDLGNLKPPAGRDPGEALRATS